MGLRIAILATTSKRTTGIATRIRATDIGTTKDITAGISSGCVIAATILRIVGIKSPRIVIETIRYGIDTTIERNRLNPFTQ
jgi:hypothetical protein